VVLLAGSWGLKYQVLVTFTKGTDVARVLLLLKPDRRRFPIVTKKSIDTARVDSIFIYSFNGLYGHLVQAKPLQRNSAGNPDHYIGRELPK
jgi:hypothetical protein